MMKTTDRLIAPSRADYADGLAGLDRIGVRSGSDDMEFATALDEACADAGIDFAIAYAHCANETDYFRDHDFTRDRNPAGIGHPDTATTGLVFPSFRIGARFYVGEMCLKLRRSVAWLDTTELNSWPSPIRGKWISVVRIVEGALGSFPTVETINDLNKRFGPNNREAVWMTDPNGPAAIVSKGNRLFPSLPNQEGPDVPDDTLNMTRGLIPLPVTEEHIVDVSKRCTGDKRGWDDLGKRTIRGVVLHRSQGTWAGNISHFDSFCPGALTDLQVHHQDGRMMRFVRLVSPPASVAAPSGWANGKVKGAYGDGKAFVDRYGIDAVNRDLESCEITGFFAQPGQTTREDPVDARAWETLAQWIASRAHDYGIRHDTFPLIPSEGNRSFVIWHQEFTIGTGKVCPGKTVMDGTSILISQARAIMRAAQTKGTPTATTTKPPVTTPPPTTTVPPLPEMPKGMSQGLAEALFNPSKVIYPPTNEPAIFHRGGHASETWLAYVLTTNPDGGRWDTYFWPPLVAITKRGDGRLVWQFGDGLVFEHEMFTKE